MTDPTPLTPEQISDIRNRLADPKTDAPQLREIALQLLADSDHWYARADYWRESYRLAKGMSDDELNALIAISEATKRHPRPCQFPDTPDCTCPDAT